MRLGSALLAERQPGGPDVLPRAVATLFQAWILLRNFERVKSVVVTAVPDIVDEM